MAKFVSRSLQRVVQSHFQGLVDSRAFEPVALLVLGATTMLWAVLGALVQAGNADQLADSYLFESRDTFNGASFPKQHSFLLKWPLFWLQQVVGLNRTSFVVMTVLAVLLTIAGLVYVLRRIEHRSAVRAMLYLSLATVLLMTPPVPYPGALLPTNMAMLTTRNLEYVLYMFALALLARHTLRHRWLFALSCACLALLFLSDGFFPPLSIGGSLLLLGLAVVAKRPAMRAFALRWVTASVIGYGAATVLLLLLNRLLPDVINGSAAPYHLIHNLHAAGLAVAYGGLAVLTNLGANPVYSARTLHDMPSALFHELGSLSILGYVATIASACAVLWAMVQVLLQSAALESKPSNRQKAMSTAHLFSLALIMSTIVAFGSFIATDHYYLVDSRYLGIVLFSGFVALAVYLRSKAISAKMIVLVSSFLTVAILSACVGAVHTYQRATTANEVYARRTTIIQQILERQPAQVLVGDYWRVLPVKLAADHQQVTPLATCTAARTTLTSSAWQPDLRKQQFAYLLTLDGGATDFPNCTLQQVTGAYGVPTTTEIIAGTIAEPKEALLFYDTGSRR